MLINEVCKECSLTKKAVEYYVEQGLVKPSVLENGYRNFSVEDIDRLKKTAVMRGLGLSVADIQEVFTKRTESTWNTALYEISHRKHMEITALEDKQKLIEQLAKNQNWEAVSDKLQQIQKKQTVLERMQNAFPGYYGNYICQHFAPYLDEPVLSLEQHEAFETILAFLDSVQLDMPEHLKEYYNEVTADFSGHDLKDISENVCNAVRDVEKFMCENQEIIENYIEYKQSAEYKESIACQMAETLRQFCSTGGYNDIFIPAMCRLSKSYSAYHETLQKADEKMLQKYPELGGDMA